MLLCASASALVGHVGGVVRPCRVRRRKVGREPACAEVGQTPKLGPEKVTLSGFAAVPAGVVGALRPGRTRSEAGGVARSTSPRAALAAPGGVWGGRAHTPPSPPDGSFGG